MTEERRAVRSQLDFQSGARAGLTIVPTFLAIFAGFGIAAQVAEVPAWVALGLTITVYAAPAQFAILEVDGRGPTAVLQMIAAGVLINLRFVLMSMTLSHLFPRRSRAALLTAAQFISASSYLLTFFRSRRGGGDLFAYFVGVALVAFPAALAGTGLGLVFGAGLPAALAFGATLFLPVYFALLLASDVKDGDEVAAVVAGLGLTPPAELLLPGWGMFLSALAIGGVLCGVRR